MACIGCPYASVEGISRKVAFYERSAHFAIDLRVRFAEAGNGLPGRLDYIESMVQDERWLVGTAYLTTGQRIWYMLSFNQDGRAGCLTYGYCECPPAESCKSQT